MSWETLFIVTNYWALVGWIALAFLPRGPRILTLILYAGVALLCLAYAVMLGAIMSGLWDAEGPDKAMDFTDVGKAATKCCTEKGR